MDRKRPFGRKETHSPALSNPKRARRGSYRCTGIVRKVLGDTKQLTEKRLTSDDTSVVFLHATATDNNGLGGTGARDRCERQSGEKIDGTREKLT